MARKRQSSPPVKGSAAGGLPTKAELVKFIESAQTKVGKREISRAFGIKGGARIELKRLIAELTDEGILAGDRKNLRG